MDRSFAARRTLARHRRTRHPNRRRCTWCRKPWPCPERRTAEAVLHALSATDTILGAIADRFPLCRPLGISPRTTERITDSATTPFGLTLRVRPRHTAALGLSGFVYDDRAQTGVWPVANPSDRTQRPTVIGTSTTTDGRDGSDVHRDQSRDVGWD